MPSPPDQQPTVALSSLSIRDYRGIANLDLDLSGPDGLPNRLVVIGGPNGCGKTTVLEAALLLVDCFRTIMDVPREDDVRRGATRLLIEGHLHDSRLAEPRVFRQVNHTDSTYRLHDFKIPIDYYPSWRAPGIGAPVSVGTEQTIQSPRLQQLNRLQIAKQRLVNAAAEEKFAGDAPTPRQQYSPWIKAINEAWNELNPSHRATFSVELNDISGPGGGGFDVYYRQPNRPRLPIDRLSSGQLELLLFVADRAFDPDRVGINFIDEPELHLDPQWHRPFLRSLMRLQPRTQFIVTTHSPEIFDAAYSYERHFLVPEDDPRALIWEPKRPMPLEA